MTDDEFAATLPRRKNRRWLDRLSRKRGKRRVPQNPALLIVANAATETVEMVVLFAQAESSTGPIASGRYRR